MPDFILENASAIVSLSIVGAIVFIVGNRLRRARGEIGSRDKAEAFFRASFPELQPYLHPEKISTYVLARSRMGHFRGDWPRPPGLEGFAIARIEDDPAGKGERHTLLDGAGATLLRFVLEPGPGTLGIVRLGPGKITIRHAPPKPPRASYWHPDREFGWKGPGLWTFRSRLADETIDTSNPAWSSSSPSSWHSSRVSGGEPVFEGGGGTFDGGGASGGWDDDKTASSDGASATAY